VTLSPDIIAVILSWVPVVSLTEAVKRLFGWSGWKAVLTSVIISGLAAFIYLKAINAFTIWWFLLAWGGVAFQANFLFKVVHTPTGNGTGN
jgi:hypothetical protein